MHPEQKPVSWRPSMVLKQWLWTWKVWQSLRFHTVTISSPASRFKRLSQRSSITLAITAPEEDEDIKRKKTQTSYGPAKPPHWCWVPRSAPSSEVCRASIQGPKGESNWQLLEAVGSHSEGRMQVTLAWGDADSKRQKIWRCQDSLGCVTHSRQFHSQSHKAFSVAVRGQSSVLVLTFPPYLRQELFAAV